MTYAVGSLVRARGREWVVLPDSEPDLLMVRPLGGADDEVTGICTALESIESATFDRPNPEKIGDWRSCRLLRDAVRLGFRSSAGPFRSFGRIAVEPRPYQLVPLLMALRQDPVRILIADDVGVGKTIEAALIARELLDRGEIRRIAVLCPPHLAEQWERRLREMFHIEAALVLPGTVGRLEREAMGRPFFEHFPFVIISLDFIKADRWRDEFLRNCPELVIVDEAHTCAFGFQGQGGRHQRHQLLRGLAADQSRHLILVTATPHSGNEDAFRSLLTLLEPKLADLPPDLTGPENEHHRRFLAQYFVQRRRADIKHYMEMKTVFPERDDSGEETYSLSPEYKKFFERILGYISESVLDPELSKIRQRVQWWSALALLRSISSSPAAAAATLRSRAATSAAETEEDVNEIGRRTVLDLMDEDSAEGLDEAPGSDDAADNDSHRRRLRELARIADELQGDKDAKLQKFISVIKTCVKDGFNPIVFCRFIPTAEYVAEALKRAIPKVEIAAVTGRLHHDQREEAIAALVKAERRILVCTDCLSEGIDLQKEFDAVIHYDLAWNPTRHEQREGRVDRYGQIRDTVRVITYYGRDNPIDGIVLDVLVRKHRTIRNSLGISIPVPVNTEQVIEAIFEGILLRKASRKDAEQLALFKEEDIAPRRQELHKAWDLAKDREERSQRSMFKQEGIKTDEVARELAAARDAVGSGVMVEEFIRDALPAMNATISGRDVLTIDLHGAPRGLKDLLRAETSFKARFELPVKKDEIYLSRTHPVIESLATFVMDTALDLRADAVARRCGAIRTRQVETRTTVLLLRYRYHIVKKAQFGEQELLAEDCRLLAFTGAPDKAQWIDEPAAEALLSATPDANITPDLARERVRQVTENLDLLLPHIEADARRRGEELLDAHRRVRTASRLTGVQYRVEPKLPADILGVFVYLPGVS